MKRKNIECYGWGVYDLKEKRFIYVNTIPNDYNSLPKNTNEFLRANYVYTWRTKIIHKVKITEVK